ncbi:rRNA N(6)-adenosine-methyltransferase ZCCHC4 [Nomia melanderi]|uniref:rRNA N(6)-adenosine-methyltransferase ZCCHC4 n=1 Tax=Nomia melanderi TaxID=2448451 RepID=UPI0013045CBC|nr:rRNA N6-adenosine-methyltransferase ZCCHC4 [Nomia melanderi]
MECFWSDLSKHPQCPHGPTLLFGTYENGKLEKFYVCAACRDKKLCKFHLKEGEQLTKQQAAKWEKDKKEYASRYRHRLLYLTFHEIMNLSPEKRNYCYTCDKLLHSHDKNKSHNDHSVKEGITDHEMKYPTELLKPLENSKQEAQYFFSKKSTEDITNMLIKLGAKQVICIGAPRIHEYVLDKYEDQMSSLLLDFDGRFHNFFGPLNYCWYNLLNNHFFNENSFHVFKDFMMQNEGKNTYVICDPPFGSRVEAMSWTIKKLSDLHKKWNNITNENDCLKIMFIFPYFMESLIKQKSNPPGISGGLKDLQLTDYKVCYENHPMFVGNPKNNKLPSPIRIFTNIPLHLLELPESDGYKYCKKCRRWVSKENKHCKKCNDCTSKNGTTYVHCNVCERCVKPYWKHCKTCKRCIAAQHVCGQKPQITGRCFKCNELGHTEKECNVNERNRDRVLISTKVKKRKANSDIKSEKNVKKKKLNDSLKSKEKKKEKQLKIKNAKKLIKLKNKRKEVKNQVRIKNKMLKVKTIKK